MSPVIGISSASGRPGIVLGKPSRNPVHGCVLGRLPAVTVDDDRVFDGTVECSIDGVLVATGPLGDYELLISHVMLSAYQAGVQPTSTTRLDSVSVNGALFDEFDQPGYELAGAWGAIGSAEQGRALREDGARAGAPDSKVLVVQADHVAGWMGNDFSASHPLIRADDVSVWTYFDRYEGMIVDFGAGYFQIYSEYQSLGGAVLNIGIGWESPTHHSFTEGWHELRMSLPHTHA